MTDAATPAADPPAPFERRFSFTMVLRLAWRAFTANYAGLLVASILLLIANYALGLLAARLDLHLLAAASPAIPRLFAPFSFAMNVLVLTPFNVGVWIFASRLALAAGKRYALLAQGFRRYLPVVLAALLVQIITTLISTPTTLAMGALALRASAGDILISLAVLVVGLAVAAFVGVRLALAAVLCAEPDRHAPAVLESIQTSWRLTGELRWLTAFALFIVVSVAAVLSFMLLILPGIFLGAPFALAVAAVAYNELRGAYANPFGPSRCITCGYHLAGLTADRCPECGHAIDAPATHAPALGGPAL